VRRLGARRLVSSFRAERVRFELAGMTVATHNEVSMTGSIAAVTPARQRATD
jgi:hypothetical protein